MRIGHRSDERLAVVATFAQAYIERDAPEHRHRCAQRLGELLGNQISTAATKEVHWLAAMRARESAHVFDHAAHLLLGDLGHHARADSNLSGGNLRRGHNDELGVRQQLSHRDRHIAGARRKIK
ncbi:unannotated protein [freshwater metagenome]|uniref:Unannotated protein n=1 Tax=freshwater metagenome TaxID=449393 RepID=A0A6J7IPG3_9ZZZZ